MVHTILKASTSRSLLRPCSASCPAAPTLQCRRSLATSRLIKRSSGSSRRTGTPSIATQQSNTFLSSSSLFNRSPSSFPLASSPFQRRAFSLWPKGNSPAPIIDADGKVQKASDLSSANSVTTQAPEVATAASEELGLGFQNTSASSVPSDAVTSAATSATSSAPHTISLETIPTELSESLNETRRTLQEYGLGHSTPSGWIQSLLEWVHLTTGLPWYATIAITVVTVRVMLLPVMVGGISNNARLARIQPQLMSNIASIKKAQQDGDMLTASKLQLATKQLFEDNKCGPLRGLILPLIQMPLFISFFFALRGMANAGLPDFATGGLAWFENLSAPDPYYVLPVISAAATLAVLQVGEYGAPPRVGTMKGVMSAFKLATPVIAYVASSFPAAVLVYWVTHNSFSVFQALLLKVPAFKRWADIPDPPAKEAAEQSSTGFMQAFRDTRDAFTDLKEGAVERTDRKFAEGQAAKVTDKAAEDWAARKKATLESLRAGSQLQDGATSADKVAASALSLAEEKKARVAAARRRREEQKSRRTRI